MTDHYPPVIISENGLEVKMVLHVDRVLYEYALLLSKQCSEKWDYQSTVNEEMEHLMVHLSEMVRERFVLPPEIEKLYADHWDKIAALVAAKCASRREEDYPDDGLPF